jgi:hypothetical protein
VSLDVRQLVLLGLLSAAVHWLVARAEITRFFWSRAPRVVDKLLRCPSCAGFWIGLGLGALGVRPVAAPPLTAVLASGVLAIVATPLVEVALLWALQRTAIEAIEHVEQASGTVVEPVNDDVAPFDS